MRVKSYIFLVWLLANGGVWAQTHTWILRTTPETVTWRVPDFPADSLAAVQKWVWKTLGENGYYDAVWQNTTRLQPDRTEIVLQLGNAWTLERMEWEGITEAEARNLQLRLRTRSGKPPRAEDLEADLRTILDDLNARGFLLAKAGIARIEPLSNGRLLLRFRIDKGAPVKLAGLETEPASKLRATLLLQMLNLRKNRLLLNFDPEAAAQILRESGLLESVKKVDLRLDLNRDAHVVVTGREAPPGSFDLTLGYVPGVSGKKGSLIGNGQVLLRNPLGYGEVVQARLNRLQAMVSQVNVKAKWPYLLGSAFGLQGAFDGQQRDSTYNQYGFQFDGSYRIGQRLELTASVSQRKIRPGVQGDRLDISRSNTWSAGAGLVFESTDQRMNPRKGFLIQTQLEQGFKAKSISGNATITTPVQRLNGEVWAFVPTLRRQVWVLGTQARVLRTDQPELGDLYRFGGLQSLRGYNEETFLATSGGRLLTEYRLQLDWASYVYLFVDGGWMNAVTSTNNVQATERLIKWGFGGGMQYSTPLGLMNVGYAANPEDGFSNGRIHIGLQVGL